MKKLFIFSAIFLIIFLIYIFLNCQQTAVTDDKDKDDVSTPPAWPKRLGGTGSDSGRSIIADLEGSVIITGLVNGNADLNGDLDAVDAGGETKGTDYDLFDVFITKFNTSGTSQWYKRLGKMESDAGTDITTDGSSDVIVTGYVRGAADLNSDGDTDDGGAEWVNACSGLNDIFIKKFRKLSVELMGIRLGGSNNDGGQGITADASNDIIVTGIIADGNADLDWSQDIDISGNLPETKIGNGTDDIFISKFNRNLQTYPWWQWSIRLGGTSTDGGMDVATDKDKNVIVIGYVNGVADFNGNGGTDDITEESGSYGSFDVLICKFDKSGVFLWGERLGGASFDYGYGVAIDSSGNIFVTGSVSGAADLNGDGDTSDTGFGESDAGYDSDDVFVAKFNPAGVCQWAKRIGGSLGDSGEAIAIDNSGNVIITGYVGNAADLNGDSDTEDEGESGTGYGSYDIFVSKFDTTGSPLWTKRLGGTLGDFGYGVTADANGNVYVTGSVNGAADLNGDADALDNVFEKNSYGQDDIIIVKFNSNGVPQSN